MIRQRLENWGCAMRVYAKRGRCLSLESRWRSPQRDHWADESPPPRLPPPDTLDAWIVESAWATLGAVHRTLLRGHYCLQLEPAMVRRVMRKQGNRLRDYSCELLLAEAAIALSLVRSVEQNRNIMCRTVRKTLDGQAATE